MQFRPKPLLFLLQAAERCTGVLTADQPTNMNTRSVLAVCLLALLLAPMLVSAGGRGLFDAPGGDPKGKWPPAPPAVLSSVLARRVPGLKIGPQTSPQMAH